MKIGELVLIDRLEDHVTVGIISKKEKNKDYGGWWYEVLVETGEYHVVPGWAVSPLSPEVRTQRTIEAIKNFAKKSTNF